MISFKVGETGIGKESIRALAIALKEHWPKLSEVAFPLLHILHDKIEDQIQFEKEIEQMVNRRRNVKIKYG